MPRPGELLELTIEKAAAGGRMLARHEGQIVLVAAAIPGERVRARVERVRGGVVFARTEVVDEASTDRRPEAGDPACGGSDYRHIACERQLALKQEIVRDGFARIAKVPLETQILTHASAERGYRMRARLHIRGAGIGFVREGTHDICDPAPSGQLLDGTLQVVGQVSRALVDGRVETAVSLEISENVAADQRALRLDLDADRHEHGRWDAVLAVADTTGVAVCRGRRVLASRGDSRVYDELHVPGTAERLRIGRQVGTFFQANRYLLGTLVERVLAHVPEGPLLDLYAGCGVFGLCHSRSGRGRVDEVESDPLGVEDLRANAADCGEAAIHAMPVEQFLAGRGRLEGWTVLVDPPRTGLSREAGVQLAGSGTPRIVYLSCDVATLARDVHRFAGAGYSVRAAEVVDLFPSSSHVETLVVMDRERIGQH
jgi:23S rRNA (uracil1939-C5)-methyltransferase